MNPGSRLEVEQKFRLKDPERARGLLQSLGAHFQGQCSQSDSYFNHPSRDFALTDEAFRIRQIGDENYLTYKGPKLDKTTKTREEIEVGMEVGLEGRQKLADVLVKLGFKPVCVVAKNRESFAMERDGRPFEIALDTLASLGTFLEIETIATPETLEEAKTGLDSIRKLMGLEADDTERRSYLELLLTQQSS